MSNPALSPPSSMWLDDEVKAWGNADWAAPRAYIDALVAVLPRTSGTVLECGSGLTTIVLDRLSHGRRVVSLENDGGWYNRVRPHLSRVDLRWAPIRDYGDFMWYDVPQDIDDIGLVVCDGPPSSIGRYGLMPLMHDHMRSGCIILLDDAHRERQILDRWCEEFSMSYHIEDGGRGIGYAAYTYEAAA